MIDQLNAATDEIAGLKTDLEEVQKENQKLANLLHSKKRNLSEFQSFAQADLASPSSQIAVKRLKENKENMRPHNDTA